MISYLDILPRRYETVQTILVREGRTLVARAFDCVSGLDVAIKISYRQNDSLISNYRKEIQHTHVVKCYDTICSCETVRIDILEWCSGGDVRQLLAAEKFTLTDVMNLLGSVAQGLLYLHKNGIVHGDVKSENILFSRDGDRFVPKITDYDTIIHDDSSGKSFLTPEYSAPERFNGVISERGDIWSFGCLIFEIFVGQLPFGSREAGHTVESIKAAIRRGPLPKLLFKIPFPFNYVAYRCLKKNPDMRFARMSDLLDFISKSGSLKVRIRVWFEFVAGIVRGEFAT